MEKTLSARSIGGKIAAIASKSQAHRLLICAALSDRPTEIICSERSKDIDATAACLSALGAEITYQNGKFFVTPCQNLPQTAAPDCGESGSTLRFLLPVAAALGIDTTFHLHGRLPERPLSPLWEELEAHGCTLSCPTPDTVRCTGKLCGGTYRLAGNISSQFISGLLFALPLTGEESDIMLTKPLESASYINLTLAALNRFGICVELRENGWHIPQTRAWDLRSCPGTPPCKDAQCASSSSADSPETTDKRNAFSGRPLAAPTEVKSVAVEGDWSNAAFWLCAGAISEPVTMTGLDCKSAQGDRAILDILARFGAKISWNDGAVTVAPQALRGIEIDAQDIPDLVPPLALVAACAGGTTRIFGAQRLKIKESDRLQSVADALNSLGGKVEILPDGLLIHGGDLSGGTVDSHNDHRIAMLAAIASARCLVTVRGAEAVEKSYPRFWSDLETLRKEETYGK